MSETPSNDELKNEINAAMAEAAAQQEPSSEETAAEVIELDLDEAGAISPAGEFEEMIAAKEQEKAELTAQLQRLAADFENYKKRARRESEDARQFANEKLLRDLLPLVDNLARALEHADAQDPIVQGIQMVSNQFSDILGQYGVERVPGVGAAFNPAHHEAMGRVPRLMQRQTASSKNTKPATHFMDVFFAHQKWSLPWRHRRRNPSLKPLRRPQTRPLS